MQVSLITLCLLLAIFSLVVVSGSILVSKEGSRRSNLLLAAFFLSIDLGLFNFLVMVSDLVLTISWLAYLGNTAGLSAAPLLYLYARSLTDQKFRLNARKALHLAPIAFFVLVVIHGFTMLSAEARLDVLHNGDIPNVVNSPLLAVGIYSVVIAYLIATIVTVAKYRSRRREYFTTAGIGDLRWLTISIYAVFLLWSLSLVHQISVSVWPLRWLDQLFLKSMALSAFGLGVYLLANGLRQARTRPQYVPEDILSGRTVSEDKYGGERLTQSQLEEFAQSIEQKIAVSDCILEPSLTLAQFANDLPMTERELSQTLNRHFARNFFDFINGHRIGRAKAMLLGNALTPITDIILSCGFSSKSSFYAAFRKETGMTPSEFRKNPSGHQAC